MEGDVFTVGGMTDGAPEVWTPSLALKHHHEPPSCHLSFWKSGPIAFAATEDNKEVSQSLYVWVI